MKELIIEKTNKTLEVTCVNGLVNFTGCSITNDPKVFFNPIKDWVKDYVKNPEKVTKVNMKFDYIDTASVKYIYEILSDLKVITSKPDYSIDVDWFFEFDDPEILELGEIIQSKVGIHFNFIEG